MIFFGDAESARLTPAGLQKRLLNLYTDSRTLEEEQGVNILFLALGTLKWIDPSDAENVRFAPLILVPVSLERGNAAEKFKLRWRQEDVASNLSLEAFLGRAGAPKLDRELALGHAKVSSCQIDRLKARLDIWLANVEALSKWIEYRGRASAVRTRDLSEFVDALEQEEIGKADALPLFELSYFEALLSDMVRSDPDPQQLPPTTFFNKLTSSANGSDDDDGANVADIESILGLFTARGLPQSTPRPMRSGRRTRMYRAKA